MKHLAIILIFCFVFIPKEVNGANGLVWGNCLNEIFISKYNLNKGEILKDTIPFDTLIKLITNTDISYSERIKYQKKALLFFSEDAVAIIKETNGVPVDVIEIKIFFMKLSLDQFGNRNNFIILRNSKNEIELQYVTLPGDQNSNSLSIWGHIYNGRGEGVRGARVRIETEGYRFETFTNQDGSFNIPLVRQNSISKTLFTIQHRDYRKLVIPVLLTSEDSGVAFHFSK